MDAPGTLGRSSCIRCRVPRSEHDPRSEASNTEAWCPTGGDREVFESPRSICSTRRRTASTRSRRSSSPRSGSRPHLTSTRRRTPPSLRGVPPAVSPVRLGSNSQSAPHSEQIVRLRFCPELASRTRCWCPGARGRAGAIRAPSSVINLWRFRWSSSSLVHRPWWRVLDGDTPRAGMPSHRRCPGRRGYPPSDAPRGIRVRAPPLGDPLRSNSGHYLAPLKSGWGLSCWGTYRRRLMRAVSARGPGIVPVHSRPPLARL